MYVPEISLLGLQPKADPDAARAKRVQEEFARLARGEPDYSQYSSTIVHAIQEGVSDFATRTPHLGVLKSFYFLEERADEKLVYDIVTELHDTRSIAQASYDRAVAALGLDLFIELITTVGFYTTAAMMINAFDAPVPGNARPLP